MKSKWLGIAVLFVSSSAAWAQMTPQQQANLPPSDPNSPQYNTVYLPFLANAAPPQERWADRWGAFVLSSNGMSGGIQDAPNKRQAEKAALTECREKGGENCRVSLSYYNQCGAVASGGGHTGSSSAPTEREAVENAIATCEKAGGSNCQLYFMGCSLPARVN